MADRIDIPKVPEMVERLCRALIAVSEHGLNIDPDRIVNDAYGTPQHPAWMDYLEDATEGLAAPREPTDAMIDRLSDLLIEHNEPTADDARAVWYAMIDAALEG